MPHDFLLASWGGPGNLAPMMTAARRLRAAGHKVRIMADADQRSEIEAADFPFVAWTRMVSHDSLGSKLGRVDASDPRQICREVMFGPAPACATDVLAELERAGADALLANDFLIGAAIAAEAASVPCAMLSPHVSVRPLPGVPPVGSKLPASGSAADVQAIEAASRRFGALLDETLDLLNGVRRQFGLEPLDHTLDLYDRPERVLLGISAAFDYPSTALPANVRYVGPLLDPPGWSKPWLSPWWNAPARERALISFSTTFQDQGDSLQRVLNAFRDIPLEAVATTGPAMEGTVLAPPSNVKLVHSAPHDKVMREVSLVITHGGHGTISRALAHDLPLLVMPMGRDQDDNAARVVALGVGLSLPPTASEDEIVDALRHLTTESQFRIRARRLGRAVRADLASPALVREMEAIASPKRRSREAGLTHPAVM